MEEELQKYAQGAEEEIEAAQAFGELLRSRLVQEGNHAIAEIRRKSEAIDPEAVKGRFEIESILAEMKSAAVQGDSQRLNALLGEYVAAKEK